jgi:hypothetical protein
LISPLPQAIKDFFLEYLLVTSKTYVGPELQQHEMAVLYLLLRRAPSYFAEILEPLVNIVPSNLKRIQGRDTYQVFAVLSIPSPYQPLVDWLGDRVQHLDLRAHYEAGNIVDAIIYESINAFFTRGALVVYLRGLEMISDALLKLLSEMTKLHPWRVVYIEDCDLTWNLPENLERVQLDDNWDTQSQSKHSKHTGRYRAKYSHREVFRNATNTIASLKCKADALWHCKYSQQIEKLSWLLHSGEPGHFHFLHTCILQKLTCVKVSARRF